MPSVVVSRPHDIEQLARDLLTTFDRTFHQLMTAIIAEASDNDISLTLQEIRVVKTVKADEPITMNHLANTMRISLPAATHLVDSLVAKDLVVRTRSQEDRRLVLVSLSKKAKARDRQIFEDRVGMMRSILREITPAERQKIARAFDEIARVLQSTFIASADKNQMAREGRSDKDRPRQ